MTAEEQAEHLYTMFDDLFATEITVDEKTTENEITDFVKKCAVKCAQQLLEHCGPEAEDYWDSVIAFIHKAY